MITYAIIMLCSIWLGYNVFALYYGYPYVQIAEDIIWLSIAHFKVLSYGIIFCILGLCVSIYGFIAQRENQEFSHKLYPFAIFYIVLAACLIF